MSDNNHLFGIRPVIEAIESGKEIDQLFIQKGLSSDLFKELWKLVREHGIIYKHVPLEKMNRLTRKAHQGVFAFISPIVYHSIEDLLPQIYESGKTPLILILDRVTDVRNFGAIARTAECAGVDAIVVPEKGSAQMNADAVKTSAGALHRIPVCREKYLDSVIQFLQESGLRVVGCTEKGDQSIYDVNMVEPTAIIMGSEEDGISPAFLKVVDDKAKIPMAGEIGSLNVSVSAGLIIYEAVRQRGLIS
jgi:23S rRNA (guanosine2251-2'-O)-methyltransferase